MVRLKKYALNIGWLKGFSYAVKFCDAIFIFLGFSLPPRFAKMQALWNPVERILCFWVKAKKARAKLFKALHTCAP